MSDEVLENLIRRAAPRVYIHPVAVGAIIANEKEIHGSDISTSSRPGWIEFELRRVVPSFSFGKQSSPETMAKAHNPQYQENEAEQPQRGKRHDAVNDEFNND